jgi:hypothetical protein
MWKTLKRGRVISLKGPVWAHKTSLTPPLFIVPNQECKRKCTYAVNFRTVPTLGYFFSHFISTIFLLMEFWFGMCTKQWRAQTVDGILVWDVHKIMATSNRLMEFQPYSVINGISQGNTDIPTR